MVNQWNQIKSNLIKTCYYCWYVECYEKFRLLIMEQSFSFLGNLALHIRAQHMDASNRPYQCHICGKGFTIKPKLDDHVNSHTGARPWKCIMCGKCYGSRDIMVRHRRKIHLSKSGPDWRFIKVQNPELAIDKVDVTE